MEADKEVSGLGNSYTTEFRQYDPRLGRWKSLDPVFQPKQSPFCGLDNNPVRYIDPKGDKIKIRGTRKQKRQLRRMFRAARRLDQGFRLWWKSKKRERAVNGNGKKVENNMRIKGNNSNGSNPTTFTNPKRSGQNSTDDGDKTNGLQGGVITIDNQGNEVGAAASNGTDNVANYYFPMLEKEHKKEKTNYKFSVSWDGLSSRFDGYVYEKEILLKHLDFNVDRGYMRPVAIPNRDTPGNYTSNLSITDNSNNTILNFNWRTSITLMSTYDGPQFQESNPNFSSLGGFKSTTPKITLKLGVTNSPSLINRMNFKIKLNSHKPVRSKKWKSSDLINLNKIRITNL